MKGVILKCMTDLVTEKFGKNTWAKILENSGVPTDRIFLPSEDVPDETALKIINSICSVSNLSLAQVADAFGEYWVNEFACKIYYPFFRGINSAGDFLLNMNNLHKITTEMLPNSHPPAFEYEWTGKKTLIMSYHSHRGLIDMMVGLVKGVGTYYNEPLTVTKLGPDRIKIVFQIPRSTPNK